MEAFLENEFSTKYKTIMYVSKVYLGSSVKLKMNVIENILNTVNKKENLTSH